MQGHLGPRGLHLNKLGKGLLGNAYILNFRHVSQVVLKKKIFKYFSMYFYGWNLQLVARSHLGPWDLHCNKIGKGPLGNATNQLSSI